MLPVLSADQARAIDKETIDALGIPGAVLMENAGRAVVTCVKSLLDERNKPLGPVLVLCGGGNNGGDGYVIARVLQEQGCETRLFAASPTASLPADAKMHAEAFVACGGLVELACSESEVAAAKAAMGNAEVIVDALFGTGLDRPVKGHWRELIEAMNEAPCAKVAVDIPSGLHADDGRRLGAAVQADATVTFACAKVALVSAPGFASCGRLQIAEIGIPQARARSRAKVWLQEEEDVRLVVQGDSLNAHKGSRGHVLALAGSAGKFGAGRLVGMAALRAGSGLVTLAAGEMDGAAEDPLMTSRVANPEHLRAALVGKNALVAGPGMDPSENGRELIAALLSECPIPAVLDADALNHLGSDLQALQRSKGKFVLTPHPGEAGRLLGLTSTEVQVDRIAAVRELAARSRAVVVLKGARTCICDGASDPNTVIINPTGGPELSTAGSGDVLAGIIAALLARGVEPFLAAKVAVYWHGEAGRDASLVLGGPGLVSSDLIDALPRARAHIAGTSLPLTSDKRV